IVVGIGLPVIGSGVVRGTSTSRPSTFTLIFSTGGGAGLVSVIGADIYGTGLTECAGFNSRLRDFVASANSGLTSAWRRSSSAAPRATNSSLNFATKLCTGQEHASPNAQ